MGDGKGNRTLIQISHDMDELADVLIASGGDISDPEVEARVDAQLVADAGEFHEKADNYVALIREFEGRADVRKFEADRMRHLCQVDVNAAKSLRKRLLEFMQHHAMGRVDTNRFRISIAANGGKAPLKILDEVPPSYCRVEVQPDKDRIREAIEAGQELPFAEIGERGSHLKIA